MASFQGKIGWKWPKKGENKNYRSIPFRSYRRVRKNSKNSKKIKKIKKYHYGLISSQNRLEMDENEKK